MKIGSRIGMFRKNTDSGKNPANPKNTGCPINKTGINFFLPIISNDIFK